MSEYACMNCGRETHPMDIFANCEGKQYPMYHCTSCGMTVAVVLRDYDGLKP